LTTHCNENCIHCYIPNSRRGNILDFKTVCSVLDQTRNLKTLALSFSGGEPLLHPDFSEIIQYARENDFSVSVLTNLTYLPDNLLKVIKNANLNQIQVSLYSMKPEIHDYITKFHGSFKKTLENINKLYCNNIPVKISCPVIKENYRCYKDVVSWGQDKNIKVDTDFLIMAKSDYNTANLCHRISITEAKSIIKEAVAFDKNYRKLLLNKNKSSDIELEEKKNKPMCGVGFSKLALNAAGQFIPCAGWDSIVLGDAFSEAVEDIWENSFELKKLRGIGVTHLDFK